MLYKRKYAKKNKGKKNQNALYMIVWECLFQDTQAQGSRAWMKKKDLVDRALTHRS